MRWRTYINPDTLLLLPRILLTLELELSGDERQHVLPAFEEGLPRHIVHAGLGGVKRLEGILLGTFPIAIVWLEEAGSSKRAGETGPGRDSRPL